MAVPRCLIEELAKYGQQATGNLEWDQAMLATLRGKDAALAREVGAISSVVRKVNDEQEKSKARRPDLSIPEVYTAHCKLVMWIADNVVLAPQRRKFVVDDYNKQVLRFLLYYFNECPLAEEVFPDKHYKLHKNIMLQGPVGTGKTIMMQIFSEYLRRTNNPLFFHNVSVTQMVNHFSIHNNIDLYTYNEDGSVGFQIKPMHLCLNDIGVDNRPFYGIDTLTVVNDFLHARNELWGNLSISDPKFAHLTTNLTNEQLREKFSQKDDYGRVIDRFKTYNILLLPGESRR